MRSTQALYGSDFYEFQKARYDETVRQFKAKEITEAVFTASLFAQGYRGQELTAEVNLARDYP